MDRNEQMTEPQPREDKLFMQGHSMCAGCGVALAVNHIMDILGKNSVALFTPGCLSAASAIEDNYRFRVPSAHMGMIHAGSFSAGVSAGLAQQDMEDTIVAPLAGDGASSDIGLQSLSAAAERNDDVLYFTMDNEVYANTGVQGSGATPQGATTTTTPSGSEAPLGKSREKKDLFKLISDHEVPYAATATPGYLSDFKQKVKKAKEKDGFRYIHVYTPCPEGWKHPPDKTVEISKLGVQTGMWVLAESEYGDIEVNVNLSDRTPIKEYLKAQGRFEHLDQTRVDQLQNQVDQHWEKYMEVST